MTKIVAIGFVLVLAGCAAYKFPKGTPTAMIRFTSNISVMVTSPCSESPSLEKIVMLHNQFISEESSLTMYDTQAGKRSDVMERLIPAEREAAFTFGATSRNLSNQIMACSVTMSFAPRTNEQYHADYRWVDDKCFVKLFRLSQSGGIVRRTELVPKLLPGRTCPAET